MAKKAFLIALSGKVRDNELIVLDELKLPISKTKEMAKIIANFPKVKNGLLVLLKDDKYEDIKKAGRNLPNIRVVNLDNLNILDILKYKYLIFIKEGIEYLNKKYGAVE